MIITVAYLIDAKLYDTDILHNITLTTTEYVRGTDMLVHQKIGKNFAIRLNNRLRCEIKRFSALSNEHYFYSKTYNIKAAKSVTQGAFTDRLMRWDMGETTVEREIVEEYSYIDRNGDACNAQLIITEKNSVMTAVIEFPDTEKLQNFIAPLWLVQTDGHEENV